MYYIRRFWVVFVTKTAGYAKGAPGIRRASSDHPESRYLGFSYHFLPNVQPTMFEPTRRKKVMIALSHDFASTICQIHAPALARQENMSSMLKKTFARLGISLPLGLSVALQPVKCNKMPLRKARSMLPAMMETILSVRSLIRKS